MKIVGVRPLSLPEVRVVAYARFPDERGWFTETWRQADLAEALQAPELAALQANESRSKAGVIRGFHAQWNPFQGKLVRPLAGRIVDLALDLRVGSPTFGRVCGAELAADPDASTGQWIWIPPGFAHLAAFPVDGSIEYLCTAPWSPGCEIAISPFADDLDWSGCEPAEAAAFAAMRAASPLVAAKDRAGPNLAAWAADPRSAAFTFSPGAPFSVADRR